MSISKSSQDFTTAKYLENALLFTSRQKKLLKKLLRNVKYHFFSLEKWITKKKFKSQ